MLFTQLSLALALAATASAHTQMVNAFVSGQDQGEGKGKYIRFPDSFNPVLPPSKDLACNIKGDTAAPSFVKAAAGDTIGFRWFNNFAQEPIINPNHNGPILTYIAQFPQGSPSGPIWSKIAQQGFEGGEWAVAKMIKNGGKVDFTLPQSLAPGKYLVRQEIIALHQADFLETDPAKAKTNPRGAEFYISCAQFEITGSGTKVPDQKFDPVSGYTKTNTLFNIHVPFDSYTPPGPPVLAG
ncbi:glycosyl hydrolase family 61-domain-containing protein [Podospora didyma]|uniref:lytic cellulose monooxygenase (C4-dehydrogenating) n=1 Tax=Podospora didyma TaxID=330526 RepID=A0AAE0K5X3_9PEZI|nr:glycosyl hydrolase family 61-domain-containing protein [Podospora didyma]